MNLNEINFSFGGLHCLRDFGCIYAEKTGHAITPAIQRNEYEIAGVPGSLDMPGALPGEITFSGTLYFLSEPTSQAEAQQRLRAIGAWLTDGRKPLIFDYEPDVYYMASMDESAAWSFSSWIGGGLDIKFTAQPYAHAVTETQASASTSDTSLALVLTLDTGQRTPLCVDIEATGTAPITGATVTADGKQAAFADMSIAQGDALQINMEPPIGAVFSSGENALPYATRFDALEAVSGAQTIRVTLTYGSGTRGASITARARGRWL